MPRKDATNPHRSHRCLCKSSRLGSSSAQPADRVPSPRTSPLYPAGALPKEVRNHASRGPRLRWGGPFGRYHAVPRTGRIPLSALSNQSFAPHTPNFRLLSGRRQPITVGPTYNIRRRSGAAHCARDLSRAARPMLIKVGMGRMQTPILALLIGLVLRKRQTLLPLRDGRPK
jgi:hypothetical protein